MVVHGTDQKPCEPGGYGGLMSLPDVAQRFIDAITVGDEPAARACYAADAEVWHSFDNVVQTVDDNMALMNAMTKRVSDRRYVIHRLEPIEGGYLQQHTLELALADGQRLSTEAVALVTVDGEGLIARIDEWLDPTPLAPMFTASVGEG